MIGPRGLCNRAPRLPALITQGTEHRFPKPFRGVLRTKAKRLKAVLRLHFRLSSSRIISHVFTPVAAQVRPKHSPEIRPRQATRFIPAPRPESRSGTESSPGTTCDAEAPSSNTNHQSKQRPGTITTLKPWPHDYRARSPGGNSRMEFPPGAGHPDNGRRVAWTGSQLDKQEKQEHRASPTKGPRRKSSDEFRRDAVEIVASSGKPIAQVACELGIYDSTLRHWVKQDEINRGVRDGVTTAEQEDAVALRRENAHLRMERELLERAVACQSTIKWAVRALSS